MRKKYKFSVVMPIYNVGLFLNEAIDSIINQTIGFENNIELILINDGSSDNSHDICVDYQRRYPNNIIYKSQENKGVSNARNNGLKLASGEYINFFDGDDIWDLDVFSKVDKFFRENDVDIISCRQKYFGNKKSTHSLDYKFNDGNKIVLIEDNPDYIQMSVSSSFIKTSDAKKYTFDERLKYGEDAKYMTFLILEKGKYAVVSDCIYNVRKRENLTSSTQNKNESICAYTDTVDYYYEELVKYSNKKFKKLVPYVQYALINAIKYRVGTVIPDGIPLEVRQSYKDKLIKIIKQIDDEVILNTNKVVVDTKLYLLKLKYDKLNKSDFSLSDNLVYYKGNLVGEISGRNNLTIEKFEINKNNLFIKGFIKLPVCFDFKHILIDQLGKSYSLNLSKVDKARKSFIEEDMNISYEFSGNLLLDDRISKFIFYTNYDDNKIIYRPNIVIDGKKINLMHRGKKIGNRIITVSRNKKMIIKKYNLYNGVKRLLLRK